jgi:hypothetical protein
LGTGAMNIIQHKNERVNRQTENNVIIPALAQRFTHFLGFLAPKLKKNA